MRTLLVFYILLNIISIGQVTSQTPIGANLDGIADYSRTLPFVDIVRQSRKFGSVTTPWDGNAEVNDQGWPTGDFGAVLATGEIHFPGTQFQLRGVFGSEPTIVGDACSPKFENQQWDPTTKTFTVTITAGANDNQLYLGFRNTGSGCSALSVRFNGYPDSATFTKEWLSLLEKFEVFRYMDWASTNNNPVVNWADRTPPGHPSWAFGPKGSSGAPWETMIELANTVGRDMWINVPHQATDDYVTQLATLFKQQLSPSLNLYVEYSNEVWNWQFQQATWNLNTAVDEVNQGDPNHLNYDNCNNKYYWGYRRVAQRLREIINIFGNVWGENQINVRVRGVLAGQVSNPIVVELGLEYTEKVWGNPNKWFYSIAGAPYYNLGSTNNNPNMTVNDVITALQSSVDSMSPSVGVGNKNFLAAHARFAKWYGLQMRGYEGGPDTFGPNGIQAKSDATMDSRMKGLVQNYLTNWYGYGFQSLNWFVAGADSYDTQYGTWALTQDMDDFQVPKIEGIDAVRTSPLPPLAVGTVIPATVNATNWVGHPVPEVDPYVRYIGMNSTYFYLIRSASARIVQITVFTAGTSSAALGVTVNNKPESIINTPNTGSETTFKACPTVSFNIDSGINVVRLFAHANRAYNIQNLQFS